MNHLEGRQGKIWRVQLTAKNKVTSKGTTTAEAVLLPFSPLR